MANRVNGILVPGGGSEFDFSYGIARSTSEMFRIAKRVIYHNISDCNNVQNAYLSYTSCVVSSYVPETQFIVLCIYLKYSLTLGLYYRAAQ